MVIQQIYIRCRDDARRGQMVVVFALSIAVFVGALALGVDLSYVRTEAENAQRAANAAALAGVIFMPNYQSQATYRAQEEATKNGFTDGQNSTSITVSPVPPYSYRLRVTISELVPIFFGHLFGLGNVRISRSATAEYLPPLQMGSPDYVLGFPRFPSYLTYDGILDKTRSPQNFYRLWHTFRAVSSPAILLVPPLDTALPGGCNALDHLAPPPARATCA